MRDKKEREIKVDFAGSFYPLLDFIDRRTETDSGYLVYILKKNYDELINEQEFLKKINCGLIEIMVNDNITRYALSYTNNDGISIYDVQDILEEEKITMLPRYRTIVSYGGRGGGKSYHFGIAAIMASRKYRGQILCCREYQNSINDSVKSLVDYLIDKLYPNEFISKNDYIRNKNTGSEFIFSGLWQKANSIKSLHNAMIAWCEEAHAVSKESIDILEPTIRLEGSQVWYSLNREKEHDPVYKKHCISPAADARILYINYNDNPFFPETLDRLRLNDKQAVIDGKITQEDYDHIWKGEPVSQDSQSMFPLFKVNAAINRMPKIYDDDTPKEYGIDVSDVGVDKCVMSEVQGDNLLRIERMRKDLLFSEKIEAIRRFVNYDKSVLIKIDSTNMPNFGNALLEEGYNVRKVHFAESPTGKKKSSQNKGVRDEIYRNIREKMICSLMDRINDISLLDDEFLKEELTEIRGDKKIVGHEVYIIPESKDSLKKRLKRSPDTLDSVTLGYLKMEKKKMHVAGL